MVDRVAGEIYKKLCPDESAAEIFNCYCSTVNETITLLEDLCISLATLPMFCARKFLWLRNANFLGDNALSKSEAVREKISTLIDQIKQCNHCDLILSASPVDRRSRFLKILSEVCNYKYLDSSKLNNTLTAVSNYLESNGISLTKTLLEKIISKTGNDSRTIFNEIDKLITYIYPRKTVLEKDIDDVVTEAQDSDFFETVDLFFQKNHQIAIKTIGKYFAKTSEARPLLSALQSRTRLMLQIAALRRLHNIETNLTQDMLNGLEKKYKIDQDTRKPKTSYSIFSQNPWYINKIASSTNMFTIKQLMEFQLLFSNTFFLLIKRHDSQQEVMVNLYRRCMHML